MTRDEALSTVRANVGNENLVKHMIACGACMKALASRCGGDEAEWELAGLLHDIDYDSAGADPARHSLEGAKMLEDMGVEPGVVYAVKVHNDYHGLPRMTLMDKALHAVDPLTGLVVASALIHPEKRLSAVDVDFVVNRYQEKGFARGARREQIARCVELGMDLREFIGICLDAMHGCADELGL
ncbi:MAG: HDIG domain-containing protein [Firmicutes bacterium]|nr:HDIG domain-containing protein [Bacillota bacterium]NLH88174.1 HDIG domain-containing protein [Bacillota bacterium]